MRLHTLTATAFGPFAGTVRVDFDELSQAGLFLLTGATGAGKSSVLDAVCFALYGQVPGDRHAARHLRCDQAEAGTAPEVVLEVSIRARRFRFTRSPQWDRPKRRGTGTTRVNAHVVVEELRDGAWTGLTNRLDDAGLLVTDLLGMSCAQFTQVAMLPQGQFMTFLRSKSQDRQAVLQRLFRTDRFEQAERWLVDRRIELRRSNQAANDAVAGVLNRLQEASAVAVPEAWELADLALPVEQQEVAAWAAGLHADAGRIAAEAQARRELAFSAAEAAHASVQEGRRTAELRDRGEQALARQAELESVRAEVQEQRARLAAHERGVAVARLVRRAEHAQSTLEESAERLTRAVAAFAQLEVGRDDDAIGSSTDAQALATAHERATATLAVAESFRPREDEATAERERLRSLVHRAQQDERSLATLRAQLADLPAEVEAARAGREAARATAAGLGAAHEAVLAAEQQVADLERFGTLSAELACAREELAQAAALALSRRETYLDVREARIHGMAAELAVDLAVGCACPVCGSAEHPSPAVTGPGAVGRADEDAARRDYEEAKFDRQLREHRVNDLASAHTTLARTLEGASLPTARAALTGHRAARTAAEEAVGAVARLDREIDRLEAARQTGQAREQRLQVSLAQTATARDAARRKADALADELGRLLREHGAPTLAALIERQRTLVTALAGARRAAAEHEAAGRSHAEAAETATEAARGAGFADTAAALRAVLAGSDRDRVEEQVRRFTESDQQVTATLADEGVCAALTAPRPDLPELERVAHATAADRDAAVAAADGATRRHQRLGVLVAELTRHTDAWTPLRREYAGVSAMAALVEGKGVDNPLRIRLSAYVLAERLRAVVDAANERLFRMTGARYLLEHTDEKGAGDQRGGLGLLVLDSWSGRTRDPATLSGGETFVVSLALALGLADTVSHEAGGVDIDTLFIDEGFGALDAATLDDVMDTLDSLREGGRVIGLVSHVAELRTRIPTQLEVSTRREGSTVRPVLATG